MRESKHAKVLNRYFLYTKITHSAPFRKVLAPAIAVKHPFSVMRPYDTAAKMRIPYDCMAAVWNSRMSQHLSAVRF